MCGGGVFVKEETVSILMADIKIEKKLFQKSMHDVGVYVAKLHVIKYFW